MCRLAFYWGPPILISEFVLKPSRSIIKQSYDARERRNDSTLPLHLGYGNLNGDGFGIGWYSVTSCGYRNDETPCTFKSVTPAWNNENLNRLASKLESNLIFAHVRAAYPGMPVSEQNCHPFTAPGSPYLFMHNGVIAGFLKIRRRLLAELKDEVYNVVQSFHSDSALSFALFLNNLPSMTQRHPPETVFKAVQQTLITIARIQREAGITEVSLLNFVVTDGATTVATRYVSSDDEMPASLYYAEGSSYESLGPVSDGSLQAKRAHKITSEKSESEDLTTVGTVGVTEESDFRLGYGGTGARVCLIASEPVTASTSDWVEVPRNTALIVCQEKGGLLTVVQAPLTDGTHCFNSNIDQNCEHGNELALTSRQEEIMRCLESITAATGLAAASRSKSAYLASAVVTTPSLPASIPIAIPHSDTSIQTGPQHVHSHGNTTVRQRYHPPPPPEDLDAKAIFSTTPKDQRRIHFPSLSSVVANNGIHGTDGTDGSEVNQHLLTGHEGPVMALCFYQNYLFSGSTDCTIKVWCMVDCRFLKTLHGHRDPIRALAIVPSTQDSMHDGSSIERASLSPNSKPTPTHATQTPTQTLLVSAGAKTVRLWNVDDGFSCVRVLCASDIGGSIKTVIATDDDKVPGMLYVGGQDCRVKGFRLMSGFPEGVVDSPRCMRERETVRHCTQSAAVPQTSTGMKESHCAAVTCISLTARFEFLWSGSSDSTLRVWRLPEMVLVRTLRGHRGSVLALAACSSSASGEVVLSGGRDSLIRVWDVDTLVCRRTLAGHTDDIVDISTVRELSDIFASASSDFSVRIWDLHQMTCICVLGPNSSPASAFTTSVSPPSHPSPGVSSCTLSTRHACAGLLDGSIVLFPIDDVCIKPTRDAPQSPTGMIRVNGSPVHPIGIINPSQNSPAAAVPSTRLERELESALRVFVRLKTVSADPTKAEDCFRGAKFLLRLLESMGAQVKLVQAVEGKNPVVLARLGSDPSVPTVTCYGHYDVQPAMESDWETDPFEVTAVDGYFIGRGVSDNKGPVLAFVYAVKELVEERELPCNVVFVFEGEEENGSIGFVDAIEQNLRWFEGTRAVLISNTLWVGEKKPCLTYGMRGMIAFSIEVKGPAKDLHSGNEGGILLEPLVELNALLASLVDLQTNRVKVPGFYDQVRPNTLDAALERLCSSTEFSSTAYCRALGVSELRVAGQSDQELLTTRWCNPTLSIVDVRVGTSQDADSAHYRFGPTRFSVIPRAAVGKVSIRFVPDQRAEDIIDHIKVHIAKEHAKHESGNEVSVKIHSVGDWWEADPDSKLVRIAEGSIATEWGDTPLLVREGGTMPVASALEKILRAPALLLPLGQSSDNCHLANERIRGLNLIRGKNVIKNMLVSLGESNYGL